MRIEPNTVVHTRREGGRAATWTCLWGCVLLGLSVLQAAAQPANDDFANAQLLVGDTGSTVGSNAGATSEAGEPIHDGVAGGASIWYRWTAPSNSLYTFHTVGSDYDTVLAIYTGATVDDLTLIDSDDDGVLGTLQSRITIAASAGTEYFIAVDGYRYSSGTSVGNVILSWFPGAPPPPAMPGIAGEFNFSSSTYLATENETAQAAAFQNPVRLPTINDRSVKGAIIMVTRTAGSSGRVLVDYSTIDPDPSTFECPNTNTPIAMPNCDYTPVSGVLVFDEQQMSRSFVVPVRSDGQASGNKIVQLMLSNPRPAGEEEQQNPGLIAPVLGQRATAILTIIEFNQGLRRVTVDTNGTNMITVRTNFNIERATYALDERDGTITVDVLLTGGSGQVNVNVVGSNNKNRYVPLAGSDYANPADTVFPNTPYTDGTTNILNPSDFTALTMNLMFGANENRRSVVIPIANDGMVEFNEDVHIFLSAVPNNPPLGANSTARVTILYDEQPAGALDREWNPDNVSYTTPRFNPAPGANNTVRAVAVQADQRTIAVGDFTGYNSSPRSRITRINVDGSLDPSFNPGSGANNFVNAVAIYPQTGSANDGKIVLGGGFTSIDNIQRKSVARLNVNGFLDTTFTPGSGANGVVRSVAIQSDGKVLIAGDFTQVNGTNRSGIARLNQNGTVDASFNPGAGTDGTVWSVAVRDSQQNIFVPRVAEGNEFEDVNEIETGANQGVITIDYDFINIPDNLRVYYEGNRIFELTTNAIGQATVPFGPGASSRVTIILNEGTGLSGTLWSYRANISVPVLVRKIFIGGEFLNFNNEYRGGVARLNDDGSLDLSYDPGGGADGPVYAVAPQADGRLLIGGSFSAVDFVRRPNMARLDVNGALDFTYDPGSGASDSVYCITLQPDGKAFIGGPFTSFNGTRRLGLARLFVNGTLDTSFLDTAYNQFAGPINTFHFEPVNYVNSVALQANGDVLIGGSFTQLGGNFAATINNTRPRAALVGQFFNVWTRADKRVRHNVARLIGGYTPGPGNMEFVYDQNTVDEYARTLTVPLRRIDGRLGTVISDAFTTNIVADDGDDYIAVAGSILWNQNAFAGTPMSVGFTGERFFSIPIIDDMDIESDELFGLSLRNPIGQIVLGGEIIPLGGALGRSASNVSITEDDVNHGTFVFSSSIYFTNENAGTNIIAVLRTGGSSGDVSVRYFTRDDTNGMAVAGQDYTAVQGTLRFDQGVTVQFIRVPIFNDNSVEPDESFLVVLTNATGGAMLPGGQANSFITATATIIDNDLQSGRANFASVSYATNEGAGTAQITLRRLGGSVGQLSVSVAATNGTAIGGSDFNAVTNTITWLNGDVAPKTFFVPLRDDIDVEGDETVRLRIFNPSVASAVGGISNATLTIVEDDAYGALLFSQPVFDADERGTNVNITVIRSGGVGGTVSVGYRIMSGTAVTNIDFIAPDGALVFGPGVTATNFQITILNNGFPDGERTATLLLTGFTNATPGAISEATLRIFDDESIGDPAGSLDTSFSASAGGTNAIHTVMVQPDGRILVAGEFRTMNHILRNRVARLNEDGSLDVSFNPRQGPDAPVRAMALQANGRLVIGGFFSEVHTTNRNHIARLLPDGTLDRTFDPGAGADNPVYAVDLLPDERVVLGGSFATVDGVSRAGVAVLETNGAVSTAFNPEASVNGTVFALAVQNDGKILVGGDFTTVNGASRPHVARLNLDGSVDLTFNAGTGPNDTVRAITLQPDGKILVGGSFTNVNGIPRNRLARLEANGTLDTNFLASLPGANADVFAIALQFDGNILVVGDFTRFNGVTRNRITRLTREGRTDPTINFGEGANDSINTVAIQVDRKILIGGRFTMIDGEPRQFLARLHGGSIAGPGRLEYGSATYSVLETAVEATIVVRRRGGTSSDVMVDYFTEPGTATPGADYTSVSGRLTFLEGETHQTFQVPVSNDLVGEPDETVFLLLTNPTPGVALGDVPSATLVIVNDDSGVGLGASSYTVNENTISGGIVITVIRTGATNGTSTVNYTTTNGTALAGPALDYIATSGQLVFDPGESVEMFTVPIRDDDLIEGTETFGVRLSNLTGGGALSVSSATVSIIDNDFKPGNLSFLAPPYSVSESAGTITITLLRTNGSTGVVTVDYETLNGTALAGSDFIAQSGMLIFGEGITNQSLTLTILDDSDVEGDEGFTIRLSNPTGGAVISGLTNVTVTILDEEVGPGSLDRSFDPGAGANNLVRSVAVGSDGKIVLGGAFTAFDNVSRNYITRLNPDGSLDLSFDPGSGANGLVNSVVVMPDGKVGLGGGFNNVGGVFYNRTARLDYDGSPDVSFTQPAGPSFNATVLALAVQSNSRLAVGGSFTLPTRGIVQLQADGRPDTSFNPGSGANGPVQSVLVQPDNRVLIGGAFTSIDGVPRARVARLNSNGTLDDIFAPTAITGGVVFDVALQSDGKVLAAGDFLTTTSGTNRVGLVRFNEDGSLDTSFNPGTGPNGTVFAVALQAQGGIIIGGSFTRVNGVTRNRYARLLPDGTLDGTFDPGLGANNTVYAVVVLPNDDILIGGDFSLLSGVSRRGIARVLGMGAAIRFTDIQTGPLRVSIAAMPGRSYVLEASSDLSSWVNIATNTATGTTLEFTDPNAGSFSQRFYRAREASP